MADPVPHQSAIRETQQEPPVPESPEEVETRLTKNWGGSRKTLSDFGVDLLMIYKGEYSRNFSGGAEQGTALLGNFDLRIGLDAEKLVGWKGGSAFLYILGDHWIGGGGRPTVKVGDAQGTSNIEVAAETMKVYEAWVQQILFDERVSILAGLHDLNSEFYVTESSGLFFNGSFGVGKELSQTGANGPSIFPYTAPSLRIRVESSKSFYLQGALFNAQAGDPIESRGTHFRLTSADGLLMISEAAYLRGKGDTKELSGKYGLGVWMYTRTFDHQISGEQTTSRGAYALVEQSLSEMFTFFLRYGVASTEVNQFSSCLGVGGVFVGLIPTRTRDRFGVALTRAANGPEYKKSQEDQGNLVKDTETTLEVNYRVELIPGVAVQPDFQYVMNPGTDPALSNASVGALRLELTF